MKNVVPSPKEEDVWTVVLENSRTVQPRSGQPAARPPAEAGGDDSPKPKRSARLTRADVLEAVHRLVPEDRLLNLCPDLRRPAQHGRTPSAPHVHTTHTGSPADVLLATTYISVRAVADHAKAPAILFLPADLPWQTTEELLEELNLLVRLAHRFDQVMLLGTPRPLPLVDSFPLRVEPAGPPIGAYVPGRGSRILEDGDGSPQPGRGTPGRVAAGRPSARGEHGDDAHQVVWSTGCFAAPSSELWRLGHRYMPDLTARCRELRLVLRAQQEGRVPAGVETRVLQRVARLDNGGCFLRDLATACPSAVRILPVLGWHAEAS